MRIYGINRGEVIKFHVACSALRGARSLSQSTNEQHRRGNATADQVYANRHAYLERSREALEIGLGAGLALTTVLRRLGSINNPSRA